MKYLPPFEILKDHITISTVKGELMVTCTYENLIELVRKVIAGVKVDEKWYVEHYQDIAEGIKQGEVGSAKSHFVNDGYFEGRLPFRIRVDEKYYLTTNTGVAEYVREGKLESGQQHFDENGYQEGRLPFAL